MREVTSVAIALVLLVATTVVPVTAVAAMDAGDGDAVDAPDANNDSRFNESDRDVIGNCIPVENGMACAAEGVLNYSKATND